MTTWVVCDSDLGFVEVILKIKKITVNLLLKFIKRIVNQQFKKRLMKTKTFELFK